MSILDSIPEAIEVIRKGGVIIVVDDEDRENEGDFLTAARNVTPEIINFMVTHGRGLVCAPLVESRCDALGLGLMVKTNNAAYETPFTVSVDLIGDGCTTGISTSDRSKTVKALINPDLDPDTLGKPGHIFPLRAKAGGVLRRNGHTEAAIDFARLAGFEPAGVIVEILNEDGTMARVPELKKLADKHDMKLVSIADLIAYRLENETLIERTSEVRLNTAFGPFNAISYKQLTDDVEHLALVKGSWDTEDAVPVRVHASSMIGDVFQVSDLGKGPQLHAAMAKIEKEGKGAIVFINKLHQVSGFAEELKAYAEYHAKQKKTGVFHPFDSKDYGIGAQIVRDLGIRNINLLSDTPRKTGNIGFGLEVVGHTPLTNK
jgi:3,4-dihydroxy 2-butanone 4-phosphate synthase/GTP cyclohydrolase II